MKLDELLLAVSKLDPLPFEFLYRNSDVLEYFCKELQNMLIDFPCESLTSLTVREFISHSDTSDTYGTTYYVIYFNDNPLAFIYYYGKYQKDFIITKISNELCDELETFLEEESLRLRRENDEYIEDDYNTIEFFLSHKEILNLDLNNLPCVKAIYSEGDMFRDLADQLIKNSEVKNNV